MEGRARGDVNVIDGGIEERETHILEGDVTESRAGRRCNGRCCYKELASCFFSFCMQLELGPAGRLCLDSVNGTYLIFLSVH